jgi:hypothetical protein
MLIGLIGKKRSGKDTVANLLCDHAGFARLSFADTLRSIALDADPWVMHYKDPYGGGTFARLSLTVEEYGWDWAKENTDARRFLQELGVSVRQNLGASVWIDPVMAEAVKHPRCVTPDARFLNEVTAIRERGGLIWEIDRPGTPDDDTHVSEHEWRAVEPDLVIRNNGTLEDLAGAVDRALRLAPAVQKINAQLGDIGGLGIRVPAV